MAALLPIEFPARLIQQSFEILEGKTVRVVPSRLQQFLQTVQVCNFI